MQAGAVNWKVFCSCWSLGLCVPALAWTVPAQAQQWSTTEAQIQYGNLTVPDFSGAGTDETIIFTGQHASGWSFGDVFTFVDVSKGADSEVNHFNDWDIYGELYLNFSSTKLLDAKYSGPINDLGLIAGVNYGHDAGVLKFLPGVRVAWNMPGFKFFNTDVMAYLDASEGVSGGAFNAPKETDSWMIDANFASKSLDLGGQFFNIEGHVEYIDGRRNEFGAPVSWHVLGQPQIRWDAGNLLFNKRDKLFLGIEYQFWFNKLGEAGTDEHVAQALAVWRF